MENKPERALIQVVVMFTTHTLVVVEMENKPERALIQCPLTLQVFLMPSRRNEAPAREGIDTQIPKKLLPMLLLRKNEAPARKGIQIISNII